MKFNKLIKKAYVLMEQDQQTPAASPAPQNQNAPATPSAATTQGPDQASKEVQSSEEGLLEVAKKLILCFKQITEANDITERDNLIQDLMTASKGDAKTALQSIKSVCDKYSPQAMPQQF